MVRACILVLRRQSPPARPMKKKVTAGELKAMLEADPEFVERRRQREEERQKREAELTRAEAPLVTELRSAGYVVGSVWDLVNTKDTYPDLIPILFKHLSRPYPDPIREGIARALAVPGAKEAGWELLKRMYRKAPPGQFQDALAVAIAGAADDEVLDDVIALVRDERLGPSRVIFLWALGRSKAPKAQATLMSLGTHPNLGEEVQVILKRRRQRRVRTKRRTGGVSGPTNR